MVLEVRANITEIYQSAASGEEKRWLVQVGSPAVIYTLMPFKIIWQHQVPSR